MGPAPAGLRGGAPSDGGGTEGLAAEPGGVWDPAGGEAGAPGGTVGADAGGDGRDGGPDIAGGAPVAGRNKPTLCCPHEGQLSGAITRWTWYPH